MNSVGYDKFRRVKYLRGLEKFAKSAISGLKREDYDEEQFRLRVAKNAEILAKIEPVYLDSAYSKALEKFVNLIIANNDRNELLDAANSLEKLKNSKTYKKDKHKNRYKDED
ncbi:hypothetical protein [Campylobacter sp. CCUG 57310]|uniref:hypothetical protein n=1 Tax=Campylobacter sp. CCUG 57310 TaxID=2517362 RepID=UPI0015642DD8|nr:hypothetical protein [Campylobacter sp. CCUG 57310]QKF92098.1 hypothetical protein CORI_0897 [Campylobacter sp. CCUG 57310]